MRRRDGWRASSKCIEIYELSCCSRVCRGAFDAVEGLMPRFSTGFYVGSMKNVPPALLTANTTGTTTTTITTITIILAPVLAFHVYREYSAGVLWSGDLRHERTALIGFARAWCVNAHQHVRTTKLLSRLHLHPEIRCDFSSRRLAASDLNLRYRHATDERPCGVRLWATLVNKLLAN